MGLIRCRGCGDVVSTLVDRCLGCRGGMPRPTGWLRLPRGSARRGMSRITRTTLLALAAVLLCDLIATALDARSLHNPGPLAVAGRQPSGLRGLPGGTEGRDPAGDLASPRSAEPGPR